MGHSHHGILKMLEGLRQIYICWQDMTFKAYWQMKQTSQKHGTYSVILVFKDPPESKDYIIHRNRSRGFPGGPWLRLHAFSAGATGSILSWGTKVPQAKWTKRKETVLEGCYLWGKELEEEEKNWKGVTKRDYTFLCLGIFNYLFLHNEPASAYCLATVCLAMVSVHPGFISY